MATNGVVIPNTPIAVDYWHTRKTPTAKVFFLSHMHADHTAGLTPSWSGGPIYCSPLTKKLLMHKFKLRESMVKELEVNGSHVVYLDEEKTETMTVSLIDANHCPGSVMFLFQGFFGTILYTGDFRYTPEMLINTPLSPSISVDVLYLDNTYCSSRCTFPSRQEAKQMISDLIRNNLDKEIAIGVRTLGKEGMLEDMATEFQTRIVVSQTMYDNLEVLEAKDVFSTANEGFIHAVPFNSINKKFTRTFDPRGEKAVVFENGRWSCKSNVIGILPTALFYGLEGSPYCNCPEIHIVPYSDHSSYPELHEFVKKIKPKSIRPVVAGSAKGVFNISLQDRADMKCFRPYLSMEAMPSFTIPASVRRFMETGGNAYQPPEGQDGGRKTIPVKPLLPTRTSVTKGVVFSDSPEKQSVLSLERDEPTEKVEVAIVGIEDSKSKTEHDVADKDSCAIENVECDLLEDNLISSTTNDDDLTPVLPTSTERPETAHVAKKRRKLPLTFMTDTNSKVATIESFFPKLSGGPKKSTEKPRKSTGPDVTDVSFNDLGVENVEYFTSPEAEASTGCKRVKKKTKLVDEDGPEHRKPGTPISRTGTPLIELNENSLSEKSDSQESPSILNPRAAIKNSCDDSLILVDKSEPEPEVVLLSSGSSTESFSDTETTHRCKTGDVSSTSRQGDVSSTNRQGDVSSKDRQGLVCLSTLDTVMPVIQAEIEKMSSPTTADLFTFRGRANKQIRLSVKKKKKFKKK